MRSFDVRLERVFVRGHLLYICAFGIFVQNCGIVDEAAPRLTLRFGETCSTIDIRHVPYTRPGGCTYLHFSSCDLCKEDPARGVATIARWTLWLSFVGKENVLFTIKPNSHVKLARVKNRGV